MSFSLSSQNLYNAFSWLIGTNPEPVSFEMAPSAQQTAPQRSISNWRLQQGPSSLPQGISFQLSDLNWRLSLSALAILGLSSTLFFSKSFKASLLPLTRPGPSIADFFTNLGRYLAQPAVQKRAFELLAYTITLLGAGTAFFFFRKANIAETRRGAFARELNIYQIGQSPLEMKRKELEERVLTLESELSKSRSDLKDTYELSQARLIQLSDANLDHDRAVADLKVAQEEKISQLKQELHDVTQDVLNKDRELNKRTKKIVQLVNKIREKQPNFDPHALSPKKPLKEDKSSKVKDDEQAQKDLRRRRLEALYPQSGGAASASQPQRTPSAPAAPLPADEEGPEIDGSVSPSSTTGVRDDEPSFFFSPERRQVVSATLAPPSYDETLRRPS